jgi:hypothetical protein
MAKVLDLFTPVDPLIEYVPVERPRDLVVLHFKVTIFSVASFLCFAIYSTYVFAISPVPADLTSEIILSNTTKSAIFQFAVYVEENRVDCVFAAPSPSPPSEPPSPPSSPGAALPPPPHSRRLFQQPQPDNDQYSFPFLNKLVRNHKEFKTKANLILTDLPPGIPPPPPVVFDSYKFPVVGTRDALSLTSFVVVFNVCPKNGIDLAGIPLVLSVSNNVDRDYDSLSVKFPDTKKFTDVQVFADDPNFSSCLFYLSSTNSAIQSIEISLVKTVYGRNVHYSAFLDCPPKFIPPPFSFLGDPKTQRIVALVAPYVTVITYNDKNVPAFIGSLLGLFPIFLLVGGKVSSWIDSYKKSKQIVEVQMSMTETKVLPEA